ncbi:MAG: hypothetical protein QFX34_04730 [Candidatus Verstraetearchaeota archaeon]|nr:hypothetical protein [Candidatus Verstraetearchaeota archaeon]
MKEEHRVDLSALAHIRSAADECKKIEKKWVSETKIDTVSAYNLYHAARNIRIVLEKMERRFLKANELHENPSVVNEAVEVLPDLIELFELISGIKDGDNAHKYVNLVQKKVKMLRKVADGAGMLPTPEEEANTIDRHKYLDQLSKMIEEAGQYTS